MLVKAVMGLWHLNALVVPLMRTGTCRENANAKKATQAPDAICLSNNKLLTSMTDIWETDITTVDMRPTVIQSALEAAKVQLRQIVIDAMRMPISIKVIAGAKMNFMAMTAEDDSPIESVIIQADVVRHVMANVMDQTLVNAMAVDRMPIKITGAFVYVMMTTTDMTALRLDMLRSSSKVPVMLPVTVLAMVRSHTTV